MSRNKPISLPYWTSDEFSRIQKACSRCVGAGDNLIPRARYAAAVFYLVQETGLSRYWIWTLKRSQLRPDGRLVVPHWRTFRLSTEAAAAIAATFPPERELLLPWVNGRRGFYNMLERVFAAADIPKDRRLIRDEKVPACAPN